MSKHVWFHESDYLQAFQYSRWYIVTNTFLRTFLSALEFHIDRILSCIRQFKPHSSIKHVCCKYFPNPTPGLSQKPSKWYSPWKRPTKVATTVIISSRTIFLRIYMRDRWPYATSIRIRTSLFAAKTWSLPDRLASSVVAWTRRTKFVWLLAESWRRLHFPRISDASSIPAGIGRRLGSSKHDRPVIVFEVWGTGWVQPVGFADRAF